MKPWETNKSENHIDDSSRQPYRFRLRNSEIIVAGLLLVALTTALHSYAAALPTSSAGAKDQSTASSVRVYHEDEQPGPLASGAKGEQRFSLGIRGGFSLPENDLRLTTGGFPSYSAGLYGQFLFHGHHQLRAVGEVWNFSEGFQSSQSPSWPQAIDTQVRAIAVGGEYLYQLGGPFKLLSFGGGGYCARWSVDSVNRVTLSGGTAQASGNSHWFRPGEGAAATYRVSKHLALESRWIWSTYGYEHVPVSAGIFGAGWRF